jgi:flagellar protein FlaJ
MSVLSGDNKPMFLYAIVYIMIPLGSIAFVIMISSMTPES